MAQPFTTAIAFCLITAATLLACDRVVDAVTDTPVERRYAAFAAGDERFEAIVMGSSHGEYCIDVAALEAPGLRPYNFSNSGSGPLYFAPWYALYRRYHGPARWALVSVDWFWPKQWRVLEDDADCLPFGAWARMLGDPANNLRTLAGQRLSLVKEQQAFLRQLTGEPPRWRTDMTRFYRGGAALMAGTYREQGVVAARAYRAPAPAGSWQAFRRLCEQLRADGTRVVFVQTPEYLPHAGTHPQENAAIAALAGEFGWPFLNYNAERASPLNADRALFADWNHLNVVGRARFSQALRRDLERLGAIPAPLAGR